MRLDAGMTTGWKASGSSWISVGGFLTFKRWFFFVVRSDRWIVSFYTNLGGTHWLRLYVPCLRGKNRWQPGKAAGLTLFSQGRGAPTLISFQCLLFHKWNKSKWGQAAKDSLFIEDSHVVSVNLEVNGVSHFKLFKWCGLVYDLPTYCIASKPWSVAIKRGWSQRVIAAIRACDGLSGSLT